MTTHYDLAIIGSGSGNSIVDERFTDRRVALLEKGVFGGTCLNVGCIPTKMFVYPAELALSAVRGERLGVDSRLDGVDWPAMRDRIFGRIDPISASGRRYRAEDNAHVTLFDGHARFVGDRTIDTGTGETITADQVVVATGSRPHLPEIEGLDTVSVHTSDTVMRLDTLPERILIVGGGVVAAEFAHVFGAFGSEVTVVNRSPGLLLAEDDEISTAFTRAAQDRWDVRLVTEVSRLEPHDGATRAHLTDGTSVDVDVVLVATGRVPNTDALDLHLAGIELTGGGLVKVDEHQRSTATGVWALGDVANPWQLKHVANHEARIVQHNLLHPDDLRSTRLHAVPSAIFSHPQVASVGLTERAALAHGVDHVVGRQQYGGTAYGWAMEDSSSFAKVLADPVTGLILGAHLIGPQASNLIQPLIQAMSFGQTAHDVARDQYWIHPALAEVVENVLLALPAPTGAGR